MPPEQTPTTPAFQPQQQPTPPATPPKKKGLLLPILILLAPMILIVLTIFLYAVMNFFFSGAGFDDSVIRRIFNVILFLVGAVSVMGFLPCMIVGIILLIQRLSK